jgi:4-amino-4-deoxy-L-arabinose transferase-like glycosyltransferase
MKKIIHEWRKVFLALLFLIFFSFGIRLANLTILPIFADEAIYIRWSQIMASEPTLRFLPLSDGKQPLFMWILMFMVHRAHDPLFIGRFLSVLSGMGTIIGVFILSYILLKNKWSSLLSAYLWSISPFSFFFDRLALVDSMLAMFSIWTIIFGVLTAKYRRLDLAILTGFSLGFAALTKSPALFVALMLPSLWILNIGEIKTKKKKQGLELIKFLVLVGVSYLIAFAMYNILRLGPNFHLLASRTEDYVYPISHLWSRPFDPFLPFLDRALRWVWIMGPAPVYGLIILGFITAYKNNIRALRILFIWFLFPLVIQAVFAKVFTVRYILFTLPPLFVIGGAGLLNKNNNFKLIYYLFIFLFSVSALWFDYKLISDPVHASLPETERSGFFEEWSSGTGIKWVANYFETQAKANPQKNYLVGTEGYFGTLPDGLQVYLEDIANVNVIGVGLDLSEIPQSLIDSKNAGNETYLVMNSSRLNKKFDFNNVEIVYSIKKENRATNTHEYTLYGPYDTFYLMKIR